MIRRFHPPVSRSPQELLALAKKQAQEEREKKRAKRAARANRANPKRG